MNETFALVGAIVTHLQSLEFVLRRILYECAGLDRPGVHDDLTRLKKGDRVALDPITNYDTLGEVIDKVNALLASRGLPERIDKSLVALRDAIAHGRALADHPGPFTLIKFSKPPKPSHGKVTVEFTQVMTVEWLREQSVRTEREVREATEVARKMGLKCFPV